MLKLTNVLSYNKLEKGHYNLYNVVLISSVLFVIYHVIIGALLLLPLENIIKSCLMNIFGILLPGSAIFALLFQSKVNIIGAVTLCYSFGYISNIISYFVLTPFQSYKIVPFYVLLISLISFWVIRKRNSNIIVEKLITSDVPFLFVFIVYMGLNTIAYSGASALPNITSTAWYSQDLLYWIENTAALVRQFPPLEPRANLEATLYYHYFSSIQLAFMNLATNVDIFTLSVSFFSVGKCILFFGSFYLYFRSIIVNKKICLLGLIIICFCNGFDYLVGITYICHTWINPFGYDIGFALGVLFLYLFQLQYVESNFNYKTWILTVFTFAACVGAKIPVGVVVIIPAGIICFSWLKDKRYKFAFFYGITLLTLFLIIAIGCAGLGIQAGQTGGMSVTHFIGQSPILSSIYEPWKNNGFTIILVIILAILYCFLANPIVIILFFLGFISVFANKEMRNCNVIGLIIAGIVGLFLGIFNVQPGQSQTYFTLSAFIPTVAVGLIYLDTDVSFGEKKNKTAIKFICNFLICIQIYFTLFCAYSSYGNGLISTIKVGTKNLLFHEKATQEFLTNGIQDSDMEALAWVRDNTPKDSIILVDRGSALEGIRSYMFYGAFSERQTYIEGDFYLRERYTTERERLVKITKEVFMNADEALQSAKVGGVDYILQTKWLTTDFNPNPLMTTLVYEGESINVYRID